MKRVVSSSLLVLFILIAIAAGLFYYQKYYGFIGGKAINAIPADAAFFIEADVSSGIIDNLIKTSFWKDLVPDKFFKNINSNLFSFDSLYHDDDNLNELLKKEKLIISAHEIKSNEFDLLFLINFPVNDQKNFADMVIRKLSGVVAEPQTRSYEDVDINELELQNGGSFTYAVSKNIFIGSFTSFLVEDAIRQQRVVAKPFGNDKAFSEIYEKSSSKKLNRIFINYKNLYKWLSVFKNPNKLTGFSRLSNFASWTVMNLELNDKSMWLEGNTLAKDSSLFVAYLATQQPIEPGIFKILSRKTASFTWIGLSDKELFFNSYKKYIDKSENALSNKSMLNNIKAEYKFSPWDTFYGIAGNEFALLITEPAGVNYDNSSYFILKTNHVSNTKKTLQSLSILVDKKQNKSTMLEKYNNFFIGLIRLEGMIPALYGNTFSRVNKMYYTFMGNYVVFANQASSLRKLIDDYVDENLISKDNTFRSVSVKLPMKLNYLLYSRIPSSRYLIKSVLSDEWNHRIDSSKNYFNKWSAFAFSVSGGNKNLSSTAILQYDAIKVANEASLLWSTQLDTSISMKPQVVNDLSLNAYFIMVQDDANNLYLIDNSGNIVWKKQLNEKIKSNIYPIDLYKNNSTQYLFNTSTYLYVIDINGNNVSNYPIRLPAPATNPVSVFDFDHSRDYRIYVACNNGKVYGFEGNGKPLAGWNFSFNTGRISQPVQSFTINGKTYLIMSDNYGNVFIPDRTGQIAIYPTGKVLRKSNIDFFLEENPKNNFSFLTLDSAGNIINILLNGEIETRSIEAISFSGNFIACDVNDDNISDYIFTESDQISVYNNQMVLLFNSSFEGATTDHVKCFKLSNGKTLIGMNSISLNKLFLLNNNGTLFKGFPVKGSTSFVIEQLNNDGKSYLVAGSEDGYIYVYSLD